MRIALHHRFLSLKSHLGKIGMSSARLCTEVAGRLHRDGEVRDMN
jgi:hypothetical protein